MKKFLITAFLFSVSNIASANSIVNGSFEDTTQNSGTWSVYSSINGWTTVSGAGIEIRNNVIGTAQDGNNFVELDSHNNSAMAQTIATSANSFYDLSFYYSPRISQPDSTNGISVFWNDVLLGDITAQGSSLNVWTLYSFTVKGTGSDVLKFAATGLNDSLGGNLDNVSLTPSPVPLPAAAWLFGSALIGFISLSNRRKI